MTVMLTILNTVIFHRLLGEESCQKYYTW